MEQIVIIGAGAVGMGVASKLAREHSNLAISVFEIQNEISLGACGIPYFIANDFSNPEQLNARKIDDFKHNSTYQSKINFNLNCKITRINPIQQTISYQNTMTGKLGLQTYNQLVIATGSQPAVFSPFNQTTLPNNCFTVKQKTAAIALKLQLDAAQHVVIIGGSYIGLEMAEACLKQGKKVTIIEAKSHLLAGIIALDFHNLILTELKTNNAETLTVYLNQTVKNYDLNQQQAITHVYLQDKTKIACDLVVLATGIVPDTSFLDQTIKLNNKQAIVINQYCQALKTETEPWNNIYAGGDCAITYNQLSHRQQYVALATSANKIGRIIAHNLMAKNKNAKIAFIGTLQASILRIKQLELASCGIDQLANEPSIESVFITDYDIPTYFKTSKPLALKLYYRADSYQLVAAQMAGFHHATLRINALVVAIWNQMSILSLADVDFVYAPPFARTVDIIQLAARKVKSLQLKGKRDETK